ncbi:MAG: hypothetical protein ABFS12_08100 [Bacteroidota bacterium]
MKNIILFLLISFSLNIAQQTDTSKTKQSQPPSMHESQKESKVYFGGGIGFNFLGDYFRISIEPMVGYKVTPKLSAGVKLMYEYVDDSRYRTAVTSNNYGGSVFTRYRVIPSLFAHAEFAYYSYKHRTELIEGDRNWVPFLLLGGGYSHRIGGNTWLYAMALWDVIQDENSPYKAGEPWISVGVSVGF